MHMGAMAVIGSQAPDNLVHVVINNGAHESVGGQPTVLYGRDLAKVAGELGYAKCYQTENIDELNRILTEIRDGSVFSGGAGAGAKGDAGGPVFLEVKCAIGARADLGRPTTTAKENKEAFMKQLVDDSMSEIKISPDQA